MFGENLLCSPGNWNIRRGFGGGPEEGRLWESLGVGRCTSGRGKGMGRGPEAKPSVS